MADTISIPPVSILRLPMVIDRVGLSRSTIYDMQSRGDFPSPIKLGTRSVGWIDTEISEWLATREKTVRGTSNV